jgi:Rieske 2Fe-2S family protein
MHTTAIPLFRQAAETFVSGAKSLPQKYFVSPEVFAKEQAEIFSKEWLLVGHQSRIAKPGDYFVIEVAAPPSQHGYGVTRESLIVVRDQKSEIRGFYNVCRHRGTRLKETCAGIRRPIQCPYHAWTYALDGRLVGAPHMDDVPGFDKADYPLHRVKLGPLGGLHFCESWGRLDTARRLQVTGRLVRAVEGKIFALEYVDLATGETDRVRRARELEVDVRKLFGVLSLPRCASAVAERFRPYDSAENDLREGPFLGGFMKINPGKSLTMSGNACAAFVGKIENLQQVFYYSIFPNMLLSLHPEYVMVHKLWPQSPERTLIVCDWLFHPDAARAGQAVYNPDDAIEFWDMTNKQDWHVCELSQQGIASRAYTPGPYSSRESIPAAWDRYYLQQIGHDQS